MCSKVKKMEVMNTADGKIWSLRIIAVTIIFVLWMWLENVVCSVLSSLPTFLVFVCIMPMSFTPMFMYVCMFVCHVSVCIFVKGGWTPPQAEEGGEEESEEDAQNQGSRDPQLFALQRGGEPSLRCLAHVSSKSVFGDRLKYFCSSQLEA